MKFSSALTLLAASGVASASILERQVQTIINVVNGINTEVGALDTAVKGFSGDPKPLTAASQKTLDTVNKGVETVNSASSITLTDSVQIQGQVQNLQSSLESVVSDLSSKKTELVAAGQGQIVYKNLQEQITGAKALATAISSKVPPEVKSLADSLSQGIISALQKGIDNFKDAPGGGSSNSGSAPTSAPSTSAPSTAGGSSSSSGSSAPAAPAAHSDSSSGAPAAPAAHGDSSSATTAAHGDSSSSGSMSGSSSSSSGSTGSGSGSSAAAAKPATATPSNSPKPATFTGAAPRTVAGSFAVVVAALVVLAL